MTVQRQHLNQYIKFTYIENVIIHSFIRCIIVIAENFIWLVVFWLFCSWRRAEKSYLFAALQYIIKWCHLFLKLTFQYQRKCRKCRKLKLSTFIQLQDREAIFLAILRYVSSAFLVSFSDNPLSCNEHRPGILLGIKTINHSILKLLFGIVYSLVRDDGT